MWIFQYQHRRQMKMYFFLFISRLFPFVYQYFLDSEKNQTSNRTYLLELIKKDKHFIQRICHVNVF